ncbi:MAG: hypothetical protein RLO50_22465 [Azospirillaceae bacterium]
MKALLAATITACLALTPAAGAQQRSDGLRAMLAHLPAELFETGEWADIYYTDIGAARVGVARDAEMMLEAMIEDGYVGHYMRAMGLPHEMTSSFGLGLDGQWQPLIGFGPQDIARSLTWAALPAQISLLEMASTADFDVMAETLQANDYTAEERGDWTMLWWGEDDMRINLDALNPANPFGGRLGRSSRLALQAPYLSYAPAWPLIDRVVGGPDRTAADLPALSALLDVLDDQRFGETRLVNVMVLPVQLADVEMPGAPPAELGIPRWRVGLFADLSTGTTDHGIAAFAYDSAKDASDAAAAIEAAWNDPGSPGFHEAHRTAGTGTVYVTSAGDGVSVAVLAIERDMAGIEDMPYNLPYRRFVDGQMRGDLSIFGPN